MDFTPEPNQLLITDEQIRAFVNPTRMTILTMLSREKCSVSVIARRLKVHPANLTHHFKLLEKAGLIKLVEKRDTGKNLEKLYRAVAIHFTIGPADDIRNKKVLALSILRDNLTSATQTVDQAPPDQDVLAILKTVRISPKDLSKIARKLSALAKAFEGSASSNGIGYSLNLSLYPTDVGDMPAREIRIEAEKQGGFDSDK